MRRPSLPKLPAVRRPSLRKLRGVRRPSLAKLRGVRRPSLAKLRGMRRPSLRKVGKPAGKLPPLKLVAPAAAAILVVVLLIGTCDSNEDQQVRDTLARFAQASREKDYQALCDDLLATSLVEQLRTADQPCEVVWRIGLSEVQNPTLEVRSVQIDGDEATARVDTAAAGQPPLQTNILLVQEDGDWRISSLPEEQQPAATP